ncbi:MAG TPA: AbrB/MazE/SpoVT family DNA-binding domain-containing protein [Mesorhizobium sp.]|jgi:AbrB family looped-hinge helix DNA binding protein
MTTLTVTAKGQITFRKEVLQHLGVKPGDKVEVDLMPNRKLSVRPKGSGSIDAFIGSLKSPDNPVLTLEEIKEAIEKGWAGER